MMIAPDIEKGAVVSFKQNIIRAFIFIINTQLIYVPTLFFIYMGLYLGQASPIVLDTSHPTIVSTYMYSYFHGSSLHLASTLFPFAVYGLVCEYEEGSHIAIIIHTYSIFWGALGSIWEAYILKSPEFVIGASGGMYGMLSSLIGFLIINWSATEVSLLKKIIYISAIISSVTCDIIIDTVWLKGDAGGGNSIAYGAHIGGFIGGVLASLAFTKQDIGSKIFKGELYVRIASGILATFLLFGCFI